MVNLGPSPPSPRLTVFPFRNLKNIMLPILPPPKKLLEGNIFSRSCLLFCSFSNYYFNNHNVSQLGGITFSVFVDYHRSL